VTSHSCGHRAGHRPPEREPGRCAADHVETLQNIALGLPEDPTQMIRGDQ
jgi:hypothetical protein